MTSVSALVASIVYTSRGEKRSDQEEGIDSCIGNENMSTKANAIHTKRTKGLTYLFRSSSKEASTKQRKERRGGHSIHNNPQNRSQENSPGPRFSFFSPFSTSVTVPAGPLINCTHARSESCDA